MLSPTEQSPWKGMKNIKETQITQSLDGLDPISKFDLASQKVIEFSKKILSSHN